MAINDKTHESQAEIIKTCKIQENNISADNIAVISDKKSTERDTTKKQHSISLSLKQDVVQKLDSEAQACNMSRTAFVSQLITNSEGRIVSFPEGGNILLKLAQCYQILFDIREDKDNNIPPERLDKISEALEKTEFAMSCLCSKIDALLPDIDNEEVDDNDL